MIDKRIMHPMDWRKKWPWKNGLLTNETPVDKDLEKAIRDYIQWLISEGYTLSTCAIYDRMLNHFRLFINRKNIAWDKIFILNTVKDFQKENNLKYGPVVRGLSRYLFQQGRIQQSIEKEIQKLPQIYEQYLSSYANSGQVQPVQSRRSRSVLSAFNDYLERSKINLSSIRIEQIDDFLSKFNAPLAPGSRRIYRSYLRGFLRYLHRERGIINRDLASLVVGPPVYAQSKPPKFLRPKELQELFANIDLNSSKDLRSYLMLDLAYTLGLRPKEISLITLDDISFTKREITLKERKSHNPIKLPLPEHTIKIIAAYLVCVRAKSKQRNLFLSLKAPYGPISPGVVIYCIKMCMRKANLPSTAYWLRHTYAQNLLVDGASIFEIKEMMGHDRIESTKGYLYIRINLMRKVLFDEEL
ncbi:MAG: tyrosine-type recombinase/integrase [Candidatus Hydrothermarchaeales archaeon]